MRSFLYISPYFPPDPRVGALRPLKFARHLRDFGWTPLILADFPRAARLDRQLWAAVPAGIEVVYDYGWRSEADARDARALKAARPGGLERSSGGRDWSSRRFPLERVAAPFVRNPELIPLGEDLIALPHAHEAARRAFARGNCEAIVVNADPFAALLVGRSLARESGVPLVADLRDPWAPCELRRPLRPALQRLIVDRLERSVVEAASAIILNTDGARDAYRSFYADLSPDRFVTLRNHADPELTQLRAPPSAPSARPFTLLFLGHLRRFVEGETLLAALGALGRAGIGPERLRLKVVGTANAATFEGIRAHGLEAQVDVVPPVPFGHIGAEMLAADLLVVVSHAGRQRIPAKTYEYLTSPRPMLAITDNPELRDLCERAGGAWWCGHGDVDGTACCIEAAMRGGAATVAERPDLGLDSATASRHLAGLLDAVCARPRRG